MRLLPPAAGTAPAQHMVHNAHSVLPLGKTTQWTDWGQLARVVGCDTKTEKPASSINIGQCSKIQQAHLFHLAAAVSVVMGVRKQEALGFAPLWWRSGWITFLSEESLSLFTQQIQSEWWNTSALFTIDLHTFIALLLFNSTHWMTVFNIPYQVFTNLCACVYHPRMCFCFFRIRARWHRALIRLHSSDAAALHSSRHVFPRTFPIKGFNCNAAEWTALEA